MSTFINICQTVLIFSAVAFGVCKFLHEEYFSRNKSPKWVVRTAGISIFTGSVALLSIVLVSIWT